MRATHEDAASPRNRQRLYINVDHVATLRQARRGLEPDPVLAAALCEDAGADGITAHLREDRRHIQDDDIERLVRTVRTVLNLEMACTDEMLRLSERIRPFQVTFVPERREEITTEGGLDVQRDPAALEEPIRRLQRAGIRVSLFVDPVEDMVRQSHALGADAIELHTGQYSHRPDDPGALSALREAAGLGTRLGLAVHAGHGLTAANVAPVAAIAGIEELNIGHSVVSRAIFVGIREAVLELRRAMDDARLG